MRKTVAFWAAGAAYWALAAPGRTRPSSAPATKPGPFKPPAGARVRKEGWFAPRRVPGAPTLPKKVTRAFIIPIHGPISSNTAVAIEREVRRCLGAKAQLVIFDIDSRGGMGDAMLKIVGLIRNELRDVCTAAYVNSRAYSAGAIIALACADIAVTSKSVIGDASPLAVIGYGIHVSVPKLPDAVRGKLESFLRAEARMLAMARGRSVALVEAMTTLKMEVWLIRSRRTRELRVVDAAKWTGQVAGRLRAPADAEWEHLRTVVGPRELLVLTAGEALHLGLADHLFESMAALRNHYGLRRSPTVLGTAASRPAAP